MKLELEEENKIMYIPVAEATEGKTPRLRSRGLKIAPPPSPRAPDMKPPRKAKVTSLRRTKISSLRSLGAIPAPTRSLSFYSFLTLYDAWTERLKQKTMKIDKIDQSAWLHRSIPIIDSNFRDPLNKFTVMTPIRQSMLYMCLFHYLWLF